MSYREDLDLVLGDQVGDVVGKPPDREPPHDQVLSETIDLPPGSRPADDGLDRQVDGGKKGETQAGMAPLVPPCGLFELSRCLGGETDRLAHPASWSASL